VEPQSYSSGERVFGPPRGTFDADWAATALRSTRPDLDHQTSVRLMDCAWALIREEGLRGDALATALAAGEDVDAVTAADVAAVGTEIAQFYLDR
jgi:hypothetical protein